MKTVGPVQHMHTIARSEMAQDVVLQTDALTATLDNSSRTLWIRMHASPRPCFTEALLGDMRRVHHMVQTREIDIDFYVVGSAQPRVYNLGGDLNLFRECVSTGDWERLIEYGRTCVETLYDAVSGFNDQVITISLIQGDALGGGFEAALSTDFMIAERGAKMGFPEMLFNLFPGMGAYSFLSRKLSPQVAQRIILSAEFYRSEEFHVRGLVDVLAEPGEGVVAAENFIRDTRRLLRGHKAFLASRRHASFWLGKEELLRTVFAWVDCAKQLTDRDLKLMNKLVVAQNRINPLAA